jgi:hypothetical protein
LRWNNEEPDKLASIKPQQLQSAQLLASSSGNSPDCHHFTRHRESLEEPDARLRWKSRPVGRGQPIRALLVASEAHRPDQARISRLSGLSRRRISLRPLVAFRQKSVEANSASFRLFFHLTDFFAALSSGLVPDRENDHPETIRNENAPTASRRGRWPCPRPSRRQSWSVS